MIRFSTISAPFSAVFDLAMPPPQLGTAVSVAPDESNAETGTGVAIAQPGKAVYLGLRLGAKSLLDLGDGSDFGLLGIR